MARWSGEFEKQPAEAFLITVDFAKQCLRSGESIASQAVSASLISTGASATSTVIDATAEDESAGVVTVGVKGGTSGLNYRITVRVTTDATPAAVYEADIGMKVLEV